MDFALFRLLGLLRPDLILQSGLELTVEPSASLLSPPGAGITIVSHTGLQIVLFKNFNNIYYCAYGA